MKTARCIFAALIAAVVLMPTPAKAFSFLEMLGIKKGSSLGNSASKTSQAQTTQRARGYSASRATSTGYNANRAQQSSYGAMNKPLR